jgi:hypothetical protein
MGVGAICSGKVDADAESRAFAGLAGEAAWSVIKGPSLQSWYNAAIDSQVRPGDVTGKRTAQEDNSVRDLINTTDSAKRNLGNLQKSSLISSHEALLATQPLVVAI